MKIVYTEDAKRKFKFHRLAGWKFSIKDVEQVIKEPYYSDFDNEREVYAALKNLDREHDLRVIYKQENDIITVITFYSTEKGRYVK